MNKRGQGLSTNAIILIILGVIVLVILAVGFMVGWDKIVPWISGNNVDTIVQQCGVACDTNSKYDFCSMERQLKDGEGNKFKTSCAVFSVVPEFDKYGVDRCNIDCDLSCNEIKINGEGGTKPTITGFENKQCSEFNGKESECLDKSKGEEWCIWSEGSQTCVGNYKTPKAEIDKYYDVTDVSTVNHDTGICGISK